jgi:transcriptional regulator with XRE-family HTH domain
MTQHIQEAIDSFGANLQRALDANGLTAKDLADEYGVPPRTVREWLEGLRTPKKESYVAIIKEFEKSFDVKVFPKAPRYHLGKERKGNAPKKKRKSKINNMGKKKNMESLDYSMSINSAINGIISGASVDETVSILTEKRSKPVNRRGYRPPGRDPAMDKLLTRLNTADFKYGQSEIHRAKESQRRTKKLSRYSYAASAVAGAASFHPRLKRHSDTLMTASAGGALGTALAKRAAMHHYKGKEAGGMSAGGDYEGANRIGGSKEARWNVVRNRPSKRFFKGKELHAG